MKKILAYLSAALIISATVTGISYAATINATSKLGGAQGDTFEFKGTGVFDSIKVGKQGTGGVTFFNGTIVNNTTTNGVDNPVTFGDNIRIDGRIYRGTNQGPAGANGNGEDTKPVLIDDDIKITGNFVSNSADSKYAAIAHNHDASYYLKTELDEKLSTKANSDDMYSKAESDSKLSEKANSTEVYTKAESDSKLSGYVTMESPTWYPAITKHYTLSQYDITPLDSYYDYSQSAVGLYTTFGSFYASPVHLPDGGIITQINAQIGDTDESNNLNVALRKESTTGNLSLAIAQVASSGSGGTTNYPSSTFNETIDNSSNSYYVEYDFESSTSSSLQAGDVVITYTQTTP